MAPKKKPAKKARKPYTRKAETTAPVSYEALQIETTPPPFIRGLTPEKIAYLKKLEFTVKQVKPGQAFIVPSDRVNTTKTWLSREYPDRKYSFAIIDEKFTRCYYLALNP